MKTKITILNLLLIGILNLAGQIPNYAWVKKSTSSANPNALDALHSSYEAIDSVNNFIYVLGGFDDCIDFGTGDLCAPGSSQTNLFLTKRDLNGNLIWVKSFWSNSVTKPGGLTIDNAGNVLFAGYSFADSVHVGNLFLLNANSSSNAHPVGFIAKVDGNGNPIWLKGGNSLGGGVFVQGITCDKQNNVYATGYLFELSSTFCSTTVVNTSPVTNNAQCLFVIKLNANGTTQWLKQANNQNTALQGYDIEVDNTGNCIVVGMFAGGVDFKLDNITVPFNNGSTYYDRFAAKFNSSNGNTIWAYPAGNWQGPDLNYKVTTDAADNIYLSGYLEVAPNPLVVTSYPRYFLEKYNSSGTLQWQKLFLSSKSANGAAPQITAHTTDLNGNTFLLLNVLDSTLFGTTTIASYSYSLLPTIAKYNAVGTLLWVKPTSDVGSNNFVNIFRGYSIKHDRGGNCYYSGVAKGNVKFDNTVVNTFDVNTSNYYQEFYTAKLGTNAVGINVHQLNTLQVSIFPNPVSDILHIQTKEEIKTITLFDSNGKIQFTQKLVNSVDVKFLPSGLYFLKIETAKGIITQKIIIEK